MALVQAAPGTVLITGTTSGVGLYATKSLVERGWRVITANRSSLRAEASARAVGLPVNRSRQLQHIEIDLGDLDSVRNGVRSLLEDLDQPLDALVCNAAVYLPRLKKPLRSPQGYEISMATNHFGHFLLIQLLLENLSKSSRPVWKGRSWGDKSSTSFNVIGLMMFILISLISVGIERLSGNCISIRLLFFSLIA